MKKNEIVYLKDGSKANYESKLDDKKHLVSVWTTYYGYDGYEQEEYEDLGETIIVDEIFNKAPVQVVSKEIKKLEDVREEIIKEVQQLNIDKRKLSNYISQNTKFRKHIINKKELMTAKSIAFFTQGSLEPTVLDKGLRGLKIGMNISIFDDGERAWGYKIYEDSSPYSEYLQDPNEDIIINPTSEILEQKTIERINKITDPSKIHILRWKSVDNKYLTKELLDYKNELIYNSTQTEKKRKLDQIESLKDQIKQLENN